MCLFNAYQKLVMSKSDVQVKAAYGAWEQSRDRLKAMEKRLEGALQRHTEGAVAPSDLMAEVRVLRTQTDQLLSVALRAITARAEQRLKPGFTDSGV